MGGIIFTSRLAHLCRSFTMHTFGYIALASGKVTVIFFCQSSIIKLFLASVMNMYLCHYHEVFIISHIFLSRLCIVLHVFGFMLTWFFGHFNDKYKMI